MPEFFSDTAADRERLRKCLDALPKEDKEILILHYFCGFSAAQIAEQLKISRGAVLLRLLRARRRLRKLLEGYASCSSH